MLKGFQRVPLLGACRRHLITQPTYIYQGEHCVPIFLNPPSPQDAEFGSALRSKCADRGVDLDDIDLKMFQIKHENHEFDTPALPRENSSSWGYLWGDQLVKCQVLLDTLKEEDDYLRGYLEKTSEELRRKVTIHYPNVDVSSRRAKMLADVKSSPSLYTEAKLDALADFIKSDPEAYLNLYRNNSYISSYDDGDTFGYDIPKAMETKLEGLMKYDWDQTAASPNVGPYVEIISGLVNAVGPKLKAMNAGLAGTVSAHVKVAMTGSTDDVLALASVLKTASPSLCGEVPESTPDQIAAVMAGLKGASPDDVVKVMRGMASPSEVASMKGKDMAAQFKDVPEKRLSALVTCANAASGVTDGNVVPLLVSGLFNNCPALFAQFAMDSSNVSKFCSTNGATFDAVSSSVVSLAPVAASVQKELDGACAGAAKWMGSTVGVKVESSEVAALVANAGTATTSWMVKAANKAAASASGLDKVEATAMAAVLSNATGAMGMYDALFTPGGATLKAVCAGCAKGNFTDNLAVSVADSLAAQGRLTPAQSDVVKSKLGSIPEMKSLSQLASKSNPSYEAVDEAFMGATWMVEEMSIPSLMMAYKGLPHPSFSNVNAY